MANALADLLRVKAIQGRQDTNTQADRYGHLREMQRNYEMAQTTPGLMSGATKADINGLQEDINDDPDTGLKAQAETEYQSPFQTGLRATAKQDAMEKLLLPIQTKGQQDIALEGAKAKHAAEAERTQMQSNLSLMKMFGGGGAGPDISGNAINPGGATTVVGGKPTLTASGKLSVAPVMGTDPKQMEQRALDAFHEGQTLLDTIEKSIGTPETGPLGQLKSSVTNRAANAAYGLGFAVPQQKKFAAEGLLKILGAMPYVVGSRARQVIEQAMQHLTDPNATDAFNLDQVKTIRELWPQMQNEILTAIHTPGAPLNQGSVANTGGDLGKNW